MTDNWEMKALERRIEELERGNRSRHDFWLGFWFYVMIAVLWAEIGASIALAISGHHS